MEQQVFTSGEAARFLHVSTSTLTKYAGLLEDNGHKIQRNPKNHRCFYGDDMARIKAMVILNRMRSIPLEEAATLVTKADADIAAILKLDKENVVQGDVPAVQHKEVLAKQIQHVSTELDGILSQVQAQEQLHKDFVEDVSDILTQQSDVIKKQNDLIDQLLHEQAKQKKKRSWLSRLLFK